MTATELVVRAARPSDRVGMALVGVSLRPPEPGERAAQLVAESDGRVVGCVELVVEPVGSAALHLEVVHLSGLRMLSGFECQGVPRALLAAATDCAQDWGCEHLWIDACGGSRTLADLLAGSRTTSGKRLTPVLQLRRQLGLEPVIPGQRQPASRRSLLLRRPIAALTQRH